MAEAKAKSSPPAGDPVETVVEADGQHVIIPQPGVKYTLPETLANYLKTHRSTRWE